MEKVNECLVCGSSNLKKFETRVTDFVSIRINNIPPRPTHLCYCNECTFGFYEDRLSDEENALLYAGYRGKEYQELREKCEPHYTKEINDGLNNDALALAEQKRVIIDVLKKNVNREIKVALDYGGNEGRTFTDSIGTKERYVYDISGVTTVDGVKGITTEEELKRHHYDFIMCNHLFEHLSYPLETLKHLKEIGDDDTYYYIEVPRQDPFKPCYNSPSGCLYKPMHEHVNFFTIQSIRTMVERNGFKVIDVQENEEQNVLGKPIVLSCLFIKK